MRLQATIFLLVLGACARGGARAERPVERDNLAAAVDSPGAPAVMPKNAVVLPDSAGPQMVRQCSRGAPRNVRGFWSPGVAEVVAFDRKLIPQLQGQTLCTTDDAESAGSLPIHDLFPRALHAGRLARFVTCPAVSPPLGPGRGNGDALHGPLPGQSSSQHTQTKEI